MRILHIVSIVAVLVLLGVIVTHAATTTTAVAEEHFALSSSVPSVSDLNGSKTACATSENSSAVKVPSDAEIESGIPMHRNMTACHDLIPTDKCKNYQNDAQNHPLFKLHVMCTEPVSTTSVLDAVMTCTYRDATNTLMRNVVSCGTLKPLPTNPRTLAVEVLSPIGDIRDVCSEITVLDVQLFTTQTAQAILVEAVTVSQHNKHDDDDTPTKLVQGLIVPFAVYAAGNNVDPMCGRSSATQCRLRNTGDGGGLVAQRPVGAVLRIPMAPLDADQSIALPTRVFRGRLTLFDDAKEYPSKLRLVVYSQPAEVRTTEDGTSRRTATEPAMNSLAKILGKKGAIAFIDEYKADGDAAAARQAAARCSVVDLSLQDQDGAGRVYTFYITLAVGYNDNLEIICFDDNAASSSQPLSSVRLELLPLFPGHTRPELRVLTMKKSYNIGVAYPLDIDAQPIDAQPIDVPVALGTSMLPIVRQQHMGTVLDLLHIDCRDGDVSSTGCSPPSTLQQLCGMAGTIRTGSGMCMHGHFVCTADAARATASELVTTTLVGSERSMDVQYKISATTATLKIGDTVVNSMPLFKSNAGRVSAGMEIVYHFCVFQDTTRIWVSTRIDDKSDLPLNGGLDVSAFSVIQRVMHETSPDVAMQACKLYTDTAQLTPFTTLQRRDHVPVQIADVRAMAIPFGMLEKMVKTRGLSQAIPSHVMMRLTRPVPIKHLTLTVVLHSFLLRLIHILTTCKYGTAKFDENGELVLAACGSVKIMLRHPEPDSCAATSKWTLLLRVDDYVFKNPSDAILFRGSLRDKDAFYFIRLIVTHPGTRAADDKYHGSVCVRVEGKETKTVAYHFNARPDTIDHVQLHSLGVVSSRMDGRALPHLCTEVISDDELLQMSRITPSLLQQLETDAGSDSDIQKRSEKYHSLTLTDDPALTQEVTRDRCSCD